MKLLAEKRDYFSLLDRITDGFTENGWADGYADIPNDSEEIINQLRNKIPDDDVIEYLDLYLQGYEVGSYMSMEAENIYNEYGNIIDDFEPDTFSHYTEAKQMVLSKK